MQTLELKKEKLEENKSDCLLCGQEIIYFTDSIKKTCSFCNKEFDVYNTCAHGHYICDSCHSAKANQIIEDYCRTTTEEDPFKMAMHIMKHPNIKMHGPEHHFLVPAVLLTAYYKAKGESHKIADALSKARKRAEEVKGGFCGFQGACGAGIGTGIFVSIVTEATPLSTATWKLSNIMTAGALINIANAGGPRCCKRDSYIALESAVSFIEDSLDCKFPKFIQKIECSFFKMNKECLTENCKYFPINNN